MIFLDTENTFRPERVQQIAENLGITEPEDIKKNIRIQNFQWRSS